MSSASVSIIGTYAHHGWRIVSGLGLGSVILLWAVSASAQTAGTSTSQTCTQDPTYCSDIGASTSTTTGSGTSGSASSGGSGGGSSSGGAGAAATVSPWMPGVSVTEWQSDTCAVRDRPAHPLALPQLVAIDDRARNARHVVDDA